MAAANSLKCRPVTAFFKRAQSLVGVLRDGKRVFGRFFSVREMRESNGVARFYSAVRLAAGRVVVLKNTGLLPMDKSPLEYRLR